MTGTGPEGPALRRDAARNRDRILRAAEQAFGEDGLEVGVEDIARRAGVGVGTVYRRFPTKESLIGAVVHQLLVEVAAVADEALATEPAGDGLAAFLRGVGRVQVEHAGVVGRLWTGPDHDPLREAIEAAVRTLLERARAAGLVREDVVYEDVVVVLWSLRGVVESTRGVAPDGWLRHIDLVLAGLRPGAPVPAHPPLTGDQVRRALESRSPAAPPRDASA